jgi:hypothetical protein
MKNLTLRVDEKTLAGARKTAAERSTSVNALVRDFLEDLAGQNDRRKKARRELLKICRESTASAGKITWTRSDLYER